MSGKKSNLYFELLLYSFHFAPFFLQQNSFMLLNSKSTVHSFLPFSYQWIYSPIAANSGALKLNALLLIFPTLRFYNNAIYTHRTQRIPLMWYEVITLNWSWACRKETSTRHGFWFAFCNFEIISCLIWLFDFNIFQFSSIWSASNLLNLQRSFVFIDVFHNRTQVSWRSNLN